MSQDPLEAPPAATPTMRWLINVAFSLDCLVASLLTGRRLTTVSCLLGEAEDGLWGPAWKWALAPIWWSVNLVALKVFGQDRHCQASVGPFMVPEDAP